MDWYTIVLIAVVAVILTRAVSSHLTPSVGTVFRQQNTLFSVAERSFLGVLDQATAGRYRVFGKVRVADVITPAHGLDNSQRISVFNQIKAKHFDFVLCDPKTLNIQVVVELQDKSHNTRRRAQRDGFLRDACRNAELPLLEVRAQRSYKVAAIRQMIDELDGESCDESQARGRGRLEPTL